MKQVMTRGRRAKPQTSILRHDYRGSHDTCNDVPNTEMAILSFSLSPEATGRIHELLLCLAKFSESVCLEARNEKAGCRSLTVQRHVLTQE